ncbi:Mrp/NBP35 family ATP-binding protein [Sphingobium phenoxybenzoativorans]|uniref:Iron-sulfur cluster carrier protein n=1 Tax=Sphingobium phenoxybenzoativorans TaxID=1592790 RepID=A0A975K8F6_9SPHN|nr:Mrp/NBP35 family ATP-binding protein [Sphingobium phenoxybenzoativorans]QUT05988.1 Mrp/NBP35 family ATP-binding protein [Sphingobium phenoxybenzoativorans]
MTDLSAIADRLSSLTMGRTSGLRLREGMLTLVLDVTGLSNDVREAMEREVRHAVQDAPGVDDVRIAMTQEKTALRIIAVGSGKGGVGKSTLSANLAVALKRLGHRVGLVDADIYGPSQPRLMGSEGEKPEAQDKQMFPIQSRWGVPMLSMGHLVKPGQAIAWRGPMAGNALSQLVDARWDGIDTLIVDLPPGTGDVQLSMIQKHKPAGAVIVSTPQDLALIDAARAVSLFEQAGVPLIGLVENMAGYACPSCGEVSDPFGSGGAEKAAGEMGMPFLGRIPLAMGIRTASDAGEPPAAGDGAEAEAFRAIAEQVAAWLGKGR